MSPIGLASRNGTQQIEVPLNAVACVGDDVSDVPMMRSVGLAVAVADARQQAKESAHYSTAARGGHGAVREVCDLLLVGLGVLPECI